MVNDTDLVFCYHRGCGKQFDPKNNPNDGCKYHSGEPFFHDAYKGWSCCQKKCTDFTEFLNIPGCTIAQHSNEKPPEPPKPPKEENPSEIIEVKPITRTFLERPPFETTLIAIKPEISPGLLNQQNVTPPEKKSQKSDELIVGTSCKNGGCSVSYESPATNDEVCCYHPGCPIFHEGLKFWSCCQKRTSDFNAFLNQVGCERGHHLWFKKEDKESVDCRWDWHQTGNYVVLAIYAKQYCPFKSLVQLNPIRVNAELVFPQDANSFKLDLELFRVIDVDQSQVFMYATKVEIKMRKGEPGSWNKLNVDVARTLPLKNDTSVTVVKDVDSLTPKVDAVDLDDL